MAGVHWLAHMEVDATVDDVLLCAGAQHALFVAMWLEDGVVDRTLKSKRKEAVRRQAVARRILGRRNVRAHPHALHVWLTLPNA